MLFAIFTSLDLGIWLGWFSSRFGNRDKIKERLIFGSKSAITFPVIDSELQKLTISASKFQRMGASYITKGVRYIVSSRAFELLLLKTIMDYKKSVISYEKVRLSI